MRNRNESLVLECAKYFVENESTVRKTAEAMGVSKSGIHKYLTDYLPDISSGSLYLEVKALLFKNWEEKHIRGGAVTRKKYRGA